MNIKPVLRPLALLTLVNLAACAAPPDEAETSAADSTSSALWNGVCGAVSGSTPVIAVLCGVTQAVDKLISPGDPISLRDLYNKVVSLEVDLQTLETGVTNLTYEVRRGEVIALVRDVDAQRGALTAALNIAADHPGNLPAEEAALAAAHALASPSFTTLPPLAAGATDRFDPRLTLPSFVLAVKTWLAMRSAANEPWTATSQQDLAGFAQRLTDITAGMRASLTCSETWDRVETAVCPPGVPIHIQPPKEPIDPPNPPACDPVTYCAHTVVCTDWMAWEGKSWGERLDGECPSDGTTIAELNRANRIAAYQIATYEALAAQWKALATPKIVWGHGTILRQ
jgi:hypothetical protein